MVSWSKEADKAILMFLHNYTVPQNEEKLTLPPVYEELSEYLIQGDYVDESSSQLGHNALSSHINNILKRKMRVSANSKTILESSLAKLPRSALEQSELFSKDELDSIYSKSDPSVESPDHKSMATGTRLVHAERGSADASSALSSMEGYGSDSDSSYQMPLMETSVRLSEIPEHHAIKQTQESESLGSQASTTTPRKRKRDDDDTDEEYRSVIGESAPGFRPWLPTKTGYEVHGKVEQEDRLHEMEPYANEGTSVPQDEPSTPIATNNTATPTDLHESSPRPQQDMVSPPERDLQEEPSRRSELHSSSTFAQSHLSHLRVESLRTSNSLPPACDKSEVASVMAGIFESISAAIITLSEAESLSDEQPAFIDPKVIFPPVLCHLLGLVIGCDTLDAKPQASSFFSTKAQQNYNLTWLLRSLAAAAVFEFCFKPLPQGEDFLSKLGNGIVRTTLQKLLSSKDLPQVEHEITREYIEINVKPAIDRKAAELAIEMNNLMPFLAPRRKPYINPANILDHLKSFGSPSTACNQQDSGAHHLTADSKWLQSLTEIFSTALHWRADAEMEGNAEFKFEFPTYRSQYERHPGSIRSTPNTFDRDPNARVVVCLMPRVLRKTRRYLDRELPGEEFGVVFEGMALVGSLG